MPPTTTTSSPGRDAVQDLNLVALAHAQLNRPAVGDVIADHRQDGGAAFFARKDRGRRHDGGGLECLRHDHGVDAGARLQPLARIVDSIQTCTVVCCGSVAGLTTVTLPCNSLVAVRLRDDRGLSERSGPPGSAER